MIKIFLNNMKYRYEVYHIIKLFFGFDEIVFDNDAVYNILIYDNQIVCSFNDNKEEYSVNINSSLFKEELKKAVFLFFYHITNKNIPWGILLGIRSTKIACNMLENGCTDEQIIKYYGDHYFTSIEKARLCVEIAKREIKHINHKTKRVSIYVSMPYCPTRCLYCSFASNPVNSNISHVNEYVASLIKEIETIAKFIKEKSLDIECIYFGGGTPTAVNEMQLEIVMKAIYDNFYSDDVREFTVECGRPDTINIKKLEIIKKNGATRICINPQSMNDETLKKIGRCHSASDISEKFHMARSMGFSDINMDIIIGLPGEGEKEITKTLDDIRILSPESVTVHGLCVKRGSRLYENIIKNDDFKPASQETINNMYALSDSCFRNMGLTPYYLYKQKNMVGNMENVGYAKKGFEGLYNIEMMQEKQTIIALGADGVSKIYFKEEDRLERFANLKDVKEYVTRIDEIIHRKKDFFKELYK